jgi:hypothetical protein
MIITAFTIHREGISIAPGNFGCPATLNDKNRNAEAGFCFATYDVRRTRLFVLICRFIYNITIP